MTEKITSLSKRKLEKIEDEMADFVKEIQILLEKQDEKRRVRHKDQFIVRLDKYDTNSDDIKQ